MVERGESLASVQSGSESDVDIAEELGGMASECHVLVDVEGKAGFVKELS